MFNDTKRGCGTVEKKKIDVLAIARLARIELDESEADRLEGEMKIFDEFAARLSTSLPDEQGERKYLALSECAREDEVLSPDVCANELISLSSGARDGYISVPITVGRGDEQ